LEGSTIIHNPHLEGQPFFWPAGSTGILLIHGFTATVAEVRPLAHKLHAAGYTVAGPLLPGHYTRPEDLNRVKWEDWIAATREVYVRLQAQCERVIVGGESTGGLISLYLAAEHPEIAAILLYAPALRLNLCKYDALRMRWLAPFVPWVPKQSLDSASLWQGYKVNPLKGALQLLELQKQVRPKLDRITQPTLIVQGKLDTTVHPDVPDTIRASIRSKIIEVHWMEQSAHCVAIDCEMDEVAAITLKFLEKALTG
jgi:carboxylesterase